MRSRKKTWLWAVLWLASIYGSLPFVRTVCNFLKERTPFRALSLLLPAVFLAGLGYVVNRHFVLRGRWHAVLLIAIVLVTSAMIVMLKHPEEQVHIFQYGILAVLIYSALGSSRHPAARYGIALVLTSLAGWGDEGIQHLLPNRYFGWSDVRLNATGALLGLTAMFTFQRRN